MTPRMVFTLTLTAAFILLAAAPLKAFDRKKIPFVPTAKPTPPEEALHAYVERVRAQQAAEVKTLGSIWSPEGRLVRLGTDAKAVRLHDVVSIVVTESLAASTDGQVKNSRASNATSGLTSLFGALKASNALQNLVGMTRLPAFPHKARAPPTPAWPPPSAARWWTCCPTECLSYRPPGN
jgi:flagellar basal body L-ring protein FlgH